MIICSDLQAHDYKYFSEQLVGEMTTRLQEFVESMYFVSRYMLDMNERNLLILGDLFEVKGYVKVLVYNLVYNEILKLKKLGIQVYLLTGNHDQYDAGGLIHALVPFKEIAKVYDKLKIDSIEGITCVFLPFRKNKKQLLAELDQVEKMTLPEDSILFMHQIFQGAQISDNYYIEKEGLILPENIKKKFKWIISGDVHKAQRIGNIIYPGSLFSRNYSDKFEEKSFLHLKAGEIKEIKNPCSPLFLKYVVREEQDLEDLKVMHSARLYIEVECTKEMVEAVHLRLKDVKCNVRLIKEKAQESQRSNVKLAMGTEEVIKHYVDHAGNGDEGLKELGINLYQEALKKL